MASGFFWLLEMTMDGAIRIGLRVLSAGYVVVLTVSLLVPNPLAVLRPERGLYGIVSWLMPGAHFLGMALLAVLLLAARWPLPLWSMILLLIGYAVGTECLQGLVPARTPELADVVQNLAGIATGLVLWSVAAAERRRRRGPSSAARVPTRCS